MEVLEIGLTKNAWFSRFWQQTEKTVRQAYAGRYQDLSAMRLRFRTKVVSGPLLSVGARSEFCDRYRKGNWHYPPIGESNSEGDAAGELHRCV